MSPLEQIIAGLEVYIDYAAQHPDSFRMAQRTAVADKDRHSVHQTRVTAQRERILDNLAMVMEVDDQTRIAVTGWLAFVPTAILEWLDHASVAREQFRDLCARTLWVAIGLQTAPQKHT